MLEVCDSESNVRSVLELAGSRFLKVADRDQMLHPPSSALAFADARVESAFNFPLNILQTSKIISVSQFLSFTDLDSI